MEPVLLLGNGINRATQTHSWRGLVYNLSLLISDAEVRRDLLSVEPGSLSLLMEVLVAQAELQERDVRKKIAAYFTDGISPTYVEIAAIRELSHILTTNYDMHIEQALKRLDPGKRTVGSRTGKRETKYNLFRRKQVGSRSIWHIHGTAESPGSIQLGFEHYSGQLGKKIQFRDQNTHRFRNRAYSDGEGAWIEPFLWGNTHVMGLSLTQDEIDLWWAIQYWSRHRQDRGYGAIVYYSTDQPDDSIASQRDSLLRGFGVKVEYAKPELLAAQAYEQIFTDWVREIGSRN